MKQTCVMMGMPIAIDISDPEGEAKHIDEVLEYFNYIDETFSTYKPASEISRINRHELSLANASADMKEVFAMAEETKKLSYGFFDISRPGGGYDPSGLVKGLAIFRGAAILRGHGLNNFYVEISGDIQMHGYNSQGEPWKIGIKNPLNNSEIIKVLRLSNCGIATSGSYLRGNHIYDPLAPGRELNEIISITVIGPNIYEADRFATAAFAMGPDGIKFIAGLPGFEGYMIDKTGVATMTAGFNAYVA
jgi:thiamine biosynthesis lipoprotein